MVVDKDVAMQVIRGGADASRVETLGPLESAPAALPHFEEERQDITKTLDARSIWLAADADLSEIDQIAMAHHQASRRAHLLLCCISTMQFTFSPRRGLLKAARTRLKRTGIE